MDELDPIHWKLHVARELLDLLLPREQNRAADPFLGQDLGGAEDLGMLPFGKDDAPGVLPRLLDDGAHDLA